MYHYIQKSVKELPYFRYLDIDNFRKQLDFFEAQYGFVCYDDFIALLDAIQQDDRANMEILFASMSGKILLTFDDGLACHYSFVYPELQKRNLFGLFFVPTGIHERYKALDVHRIHYLIGRFGGKALLDMVKIDSSMKEHFDTFNNTTYIHQDNDSYTQEFKKLFNYYLKYEYRESLLDSLVQNLSSDEEIFCTLYMDISQIKEMSANNMIIGSHSVNHLVLSKLNVESQYNEIANSFTYLNDTMGGG